MFFFHIFLSFVHSVVDAWNKMMPRTSMHMTYLSHLCIYWQIMVCFLVINALAYVNTKAWLC